MLNMLPNLRKFSEKIYPEHKSLFQSLAQGQKPHTLLITCSDSRIDPNLVTQTEPGEIFVVRNAGNIIPPYGASKGGEEASIEFAIEGLGVKNIIICGHSHCGAMAALAHGLNEEALPSTASWLKHASATKRTLKDQNCSVEDHTKTNILVQIQNLKTHPSVAAALSQNRLHLFGWVYHFETGSISIYHKKTKEFVSSSHFKNTTDANLDEFAL
jgi:carbonic anhydrase